MPVLICLRKELWTGLISVGDQVPTCPVFTRAKIKSRLGILVNFPVTLSTIKQIIVTWHIDQEILIFRFNYLTERQNSKNFVFLLPYVVQLIGPVSRVFANGPGDQGSIPGQVIAKTWKKEKRYLIPPC